LEAANRELEAFSYSASHDLRAPLRAMDGFARVLQEDIAPQLPDQGQEDVQIVRDSSQRMGQLVDALLAFFRLGRQPLAKRLVLPADLVRRVLAELATEREGRRVELIVGDLPACWGDAALLEQVFANLLGNALKFTRPREAATVEVGWSVDAARPGGAYCVRDHGVGFDMRYVDKLFGVFQRLHGREAFDGTGVGLAIVQRTIHRHGGPVGAVGEPDRGATFWFSLPAAAADADSAAEWAIAPDGANRSQ
jgi:signal transduction histidine kinase